MASKSSGRNEHELASLRLRLADRERHLALVVLCSELAHDLAAPVGFFRQLLRGVKAGRPVGADDISIGDEELDGIQRLMTSLRRLSMPRPKLEDVRVSWAVNRALLLSTDTLGPRRIRVEVDVPAELTVAAEPDLLLIALGHLLTMAADGIAPGGTVGIRATASKSGHLLEIWGDGAMPSDQLSTLSSQGQDACSNLRADGRGLELPLCARIVRGLGWMLSQQRDGDRTSFQVSIPSAVR